MTDEIQPTATRLETSVDPATEFTSVVARPGERPPDRLKQLTIGLAAVAGAVLIVAAVVVLTDGDDTETSTGATTVTTAAPSTGTVPDTIAAAVGATVAPSDPFSPTPFFTTYGSAYAFSHDGTRIATSSVSDPTTIWDLASGSPLVTLNDTASTLAFTPDDTLLMSTGWVDGARGYTHTWNIADGRQVAEFLPGVGTRLSPDGKYVITSESGRLQFFDVHTGDLAASVSLPGGANPWWLASPDGSAILFGTGELLDSVFDPASGGVRRISDADGCGLGATGFSDDGRLIIAGCSQEQRTLVLIDTATGQPVLHIVDVELMALSHDGSLALTRSTTADQNGDVSVWDTATGSLLHTLSLPTSLADQVFVLSPAMMPDSRYPQAAVSNDGSRIAATILLETGPVTAVWDVASEALIFLGTGVGGPTFSPDGTMLAVVGADSPNPLARFPIAVYRL